MDIEVAEERHDDALVLLPIGRLDSGNAHSFESIVMQHLSGGEQRLIVDFSRLTFISSSGMRVLLIATKALHARKGKIALCAMKTISRRSSGSAASIRSSRSGIRGHRHWMSSLDIRPSGVTHAELSQDLPGLLEGGADAFKDDRLSARRRQQGSLLASSWRHRGRFPVAPARSEAEAAANAHILVGDVSQDFVEITTGLTPRAQVLQPLRLINASPVIPIGFPPLVVRSVQHTVGRFASQTVITARPASAVWRQVLLPLNVNYSCRFGRLLVRRRTVRVGVAAGSEDAEDQTA